MSGYLIASRKYQQFYSILTTEILLFSSILSCKNRSSSPQLGAKIIGGAPVKIEEFPYAVKLFIADNLCAGSILNSWTILTAAHCFDANRDVNDMIVEVGSTYVHQKDSKLYDVLRIVTHKDYNRAMLFAADIALMFVDGPMKFNKKIKKALLNNNYEWMNIREKNIMAVGWGWTMPNGPISMNGLMRTSLKYVPKKKCEKYHNMKFTKEMFCLYGEGARDTCKGDSGGAVSWQGRIIGVISHGHGCAIKGKPSVYISVLYYLDWIKKNVNEFLKSYCRIKYKE